MVGESPQPYNPDIISLWTDIISILEFFKENEILPLHSGKIPKKYLDKIIQFLCKENGENVPCGKRVQFIYALLIELRILVIRNNRLMLSSRFYEIMKKDETEIVNLYFQSWLETGYYSELEMVEHLAVKRPSEYLGANDIPDENAISSARKYIVTAITELFRQSSRLPLSTVVHFIQSGNRAFLIAESKAKKIEDKFYRGIFSVNSIENKEQGLPRWNNWKNVEGAFISEVLVFSLRSLGLIEIVEESVTEPLLTLTQAGEVCLGFAERITVPDSGRKPLVIQPNFEITLYFDSAPLHLAWYIELIGKNLSRGIVSTYRFDFQKMYYLLQFGWTIKELITVLQKNSGNPLPQNVLFTIRDLSTQFTRIIIHKHAALIEFTDPAIQDKVLKKLDKKAYVKCAKNYYLLKEPYLEKAFSLLKKNVKELSYTNYWDRPPKLFRFYPDNTFICLSSHPDFESRRFIKEFTVNVYKEGILYHRLLLKIKQHSKNWFCSAEECRRFLQFRCEGKLPECVTLLISSWFDKTGEIEIIKNPLILFENSTVATQISSIPEAQKYFERKINETTFVIRKGQLSHLKKWLRRFGIRHLITA